MSVGYQWIWKKHINIFTIKFCWIIILTCVGDFLKRISVYDDLGNVIKQRVGYVGKIRDWMTVEEHLYLFARMGVVYRRIRRVT